MKQTIRILGARARTVCPATNGFHSMALLFARTMFGPGTDVTPVHSKQSRQVLWLRPWVLLLSSLVCAASLADPVAHWALSEGTGTTTADGSGNGKTGTLVNGPVWTTGYNGNALTFNGGNRYVTVNGGGVLANLHTTGLTIAAWVKLTSGGGSAARIVDKHNNNTGWFLKSDSSGILQFAGDTFTTAPVIRYSAGVAAVNTWQHVAVSWDGSVNSANVHIYLNGVLSDGTASNGSGTPKDDSTVPFAIGNRPVDAARGFKGDIDEVRVYSQVLSATEIQAIFSGDTQAPTAPTSLAATAASSTQINLSWTASTDNIGVTGYLIERCQGAGCSNFVQVATSTSPSYSNTALAASTSYSYRVRARDAASNVGSYSSTVSATTPAAGDTQAPTVPAGLTATAVSATQINLNWTASTDNVGVTGYLLERCQGASCSSFSQIATPTTTTYSDTARTASTSYSYRVRARDAIPNYSGYSSTATVTTPAAADTQVPTAPSALAATAASATQINLSWNGSTDNVGVTNYLIERCQGSGCSNFTQVATSIGTSYSNIALTAATLYAYRVRATDAASNLSTYSNTASATTQSSPGIQAIGTWQLDEGTGATTADSSGNGKTGTLVNGPVWSAGHTGNALTFNGGNRYVTINGGGTLANLHATGLTIAAWVNPTTGNASAARIVDKNNNNTGWFLKIDGSGSLQFTGDSFTTTAVQRNSSSTLAMGTWQHVAVSWDGSINSSNIHIYINGVLADGTGTNGAGTGKDDSSVPFAIGNRPVDAARGFKGTIDEVRVYNQALGATEIQAVFTGDSQAPTAPTSLVATAPSSSQINLSWTASTDNIDVTGYLIERCQGPGCSSFAQIATPTATSYSDTGLSAATSYSYRVRAKDAANNLSSYSTTSSATTPTTSDTQTPTAPSGLTATAASAVQINLSWSASTDNVGVTGYLIERCQGASCSNFAQIATPATITYSDTGLTASTVYRYRVRARDAANNLSGYSSIVSATTQAATDTQAPTAPSGLNATPASSTRINLSWTASTDNIGVTGYLIERCQGASCSNFTQIATPIASPFSNTDLGVGAVYRYRVRARDAANNLSVYSPIATATTQSSSAVDCD